VLHNVIRHSEATAVDIALELTRRSLVMRVQDNGKGFDLPSVDQGHGLNNLRHRSAQLDGQLRIETKPGHGTKIWFEVKFS